ncbi:hypothetical protein BU23DRAFT_603632 [Bimuria novae-zelandiae CBS 107.79]|uniref:Rhodopsin domain-containing protein n=1 Tax=Bimuria novae-zelandiae CBS 107.79 TaxID=1447943 RepID=A0A6A5UM66_9PLEO|nr:hypothetical protein BU23DRAFT_603632 [Bimuria novae-zelandiae CBS 107.79]
MVIIWDVGFSLAIILFCVRTGKVSTFWLTTTSKELTSKCINGFVYMHVLSITDFIMDMIIILMPIPFLWKLRLPLKRKFGVLLVFILGPLTCAASLVRLIWMEDQMTIGSNPSDHGDPLIFWYIIECELALLAVSLPALSGIGRTRPVDAIVRSVRSVRSKLSLRSGASASSRSDGRNSGDENAGSSPPYGSSMGKERVEHVVVLPDVESPSRSGGSAVV